MLHCDDNDDDDQWTYQHAIKLTQLLDSYDPYLSAIIKVTYKFQTRVELCDAVLNGFAFIRRADLLVDPSILLELLLIAGIRFRMSDYLYTVL